MSSRSSSCCAVGVLIGLVLVVPALGDRAARASFPRITVTPAAESELVPGELVRLQVRVSDPDGERVGLRLLDPPPGLDFQPRTSVLPPLVLALEWAVPARGLARRTRLTFEAEDASGRTTRLEVAYQVRDGLARVVTGDVTGDGRLDVVAAARWADLPGTTNAGAVYVWAGGGSPGGAPSATLGAAVPASGDRIGDDGIQLGDVTGDGVLDVVADSRAVNAGGVRDCGAIHVWAGGGGLLGVRAETARLVAPAPTELLQLHGSTLVDVTGDGILDLVASSGFATVAGVVNAGACYVWAGGPGLAGEPAPAAVLAVLGGQADDEFAVQRLVDLTGDGVLDLVGFSRADVGGIPDLGAYFVFPGGPSLAGSVAPSARLATPYLGTTGPLSFADLTGDGIQDVLAVVQRGDVNGVSDAGALVVWAGGTLVGQPTPRAFLSVPGAAAGDQLGASGVQLEDVTGDGWSDVVASSIFVDLAGAVDAGAIHVWRGGPALSGLPAPRAVLTIPAAAAEDHLFAVDLPRVDLTGDGVPELVARSRVDALGVVDSGALFVWSCGPALSGNPAPLAMLHVPGAFPGDDLGAASGLHGVRCADLDGNGIPQLVAGASAADRNPPGQRENGAIYVFPDGTSLSGTVIPKATLLVPTPTNGDQFPGPIGSALQFADVSGDGLLDLVAGSVHWHDGRGILLVWRGGPLAGQPAPDAALTAPAAMPFDHLGIAGDAPVQLADLDRDGILDLVVGGSSLDGSALDSGVVSVWRGGPALTGTPAPLASLLNPSAVTSELLATDALRLADLDGDGAPDVLAGTSLAEPGGIDGAGALFLWRADPALAGTSAPDATLAVPGAAANDHLGG